MIKGGYILQPRVIDHSEISKAPPHTREIWMYLLRSANHAAKQSSGRMIERGQLHTSYSDIREALSWQVGYRKEMYKKHHCETAMKLLMKENMITTTKTTRGMIVTVCNYDYYQNPKNYETDSETDNETYKKPTMNRHDKQECKNERNNITHTLDNKAEKFKQLFEDFRKKYPGTKRGLTTEYQFFCKKHRDWIDVLPTLLPSLERQIDNTNRKKELGQFAPSWKNLSTWINNRCWEEEEHADEFETAKSNAPAFIARNPIATNT